MRSNVRLARGQWCAWSPRCSTKTLIVFGGKINDLNINLQFVQDRLALRYATENPVIFSSFVRYIAYGRTWVTRVEIHTVRGDGC